MSALCYFLPGSLVSNTINFALCSLNLALTLKVNPDYFVALYSLYGCAMGIYLSVQFILVINLLNAKTQGQLRLVDALAEELSVERIQSVRTQVIMTSLQGLFWTSVIIVYTLDIVHELKDTHDLTCPTTQCTWYAVAFTLAYAKALIVMAQMTCLAFVLYRAASVPYRPHNVSSLLDLDMDELMLLREEARRIRVNHASLHRWGSGVEGHPTRPGPDYAGGSSAELRAEAISLSYMLNSPPIFDPETLHGRRRTRSTGAKNANEPVAQHLTLQDVNTIVTSPNAVDLTLPPINVTEGSARTKMRLSVHELSAHEAGAPVIGLAEGCHRPLSIHTSAARPHSIETLLSVSLESPVSSDQGNPFIDANDSRFNFEAAPSSTTSDAPSEVDARAAQTGSVTRPLKPAFNLTGAGGTPYRRSVLRWDPSIPNSPQIPIENPFEYEDAPAQSPESRDLYSPESRYSTQSLQSVYPSTPTVLRRQLARMIGMPETPDTPQDEAVKTPRD